MLSLRDAGIEWTRDGNELEANHRTRGAAIYSRTEDFTFTSPETFTGIPFTADEEATGCFERQNGNITCNVGGVMGLSVAVRFKSTAPGNVERLMAIRVVKNGQEQQSLKALVGRSKGEDEIEAANFSGLIFTDPGDVIQLQGYVSHTDVIVSGSPIFDIPLAAVMAIWRHTR